MSYPDEDERRVEQMLDDLAGRDAVPDSVKVMNEMMVAAIARNGMPEPFILSRIVATGDPLADVKRAMKQIEETPPLRASATVHHPRCSTLASSKLSDCNCGGWAFPSRT